MQWWYPCGQCPASSQGRGCLESSIVTSETNLSRLKFSLFLVRFGCFIAYLVHNQVLKHLIWIILLRSRSSHICKTFPPAHTSIKIYTQIILVTAMVPGQSLSQLCSDCSKSKSKAPLTPFTCKTGPFFYHVVPPFFQPPLCTSHFHSGLADLFLSVLQKPTGKVHTRER